MIPPLKRLKKITCARVATILPLPLGSGCER
jgi:hypothetical protein